MELDDKVLFNSNICIFADTNERIAAEFTRNDRNSGTFYWSDAYDVGIIRNNNDSPLPNFK